MKHKKKLFSICRQQFRMISAHIFDGNLLFHQHYVPTHQANPLLRMFFCEGGRKGGAWGGDEDSS